jgi:hypothetical protein
MQDHRRLRQVVEEQRPIPVAREHGVAPFATIQRVPGSAGIFDPEFSVQATDVALERGPDQLNM